MILEEKLAKRLSDWNPSQGRSQLALEENGWTIAFTLERRDELSCLLWDVTFTRKQTTDTLQAWAEQIEKNISAALEPIKILEVDNQRNEAILRSSDLRTLSDASLHYDVFANGTKTATLRRYKTLNAKNAKREQTGFALTTEGFARLIASVTGAK